MSATYLAGTALDELDQAQAVIDWHLVTCAVCGTNKLCGERREAERIFQGYGRLPRRQPGVVGTKVFNISTSRGGTS